MDGPEVCVQGCDYPNLRGTSKDTNDCKENELLKLCVGVDILSLENGGLQFKASLDGVTNLRPDSEEFRWYLKLRCANCGEVTGKWNYVDRLEKQPLKGGRGTASLVSKCKLCSRENSLDVLEDSIVAYNIEDSESFKTVVVFDCRGTEPVDFDPRSGFIADGDGSTTTFSNIDLGSKEWTEYDERANNPVSIFEVEHKFIKL